MTRLPLIEVGRLVDVAQRVADEQRPAERLDPRDGGRGDGVGAPRDIVEQRRVGARQAEQDVAAVARRVDHGIMALELRRCLGKALAVELGTIGADQQDALAAVDHARWPPPPAAVPDRPAPGRDSRTPVGRCPAHDGSSGCGVAHSSGVAEPGRERMRDGVGEHALRQPGGTLLRRDAGSAAS